MLLDKLTCVRIEKNYLSAEPSACDFQKVYLKSIPCCNKCQVNLFLFQRFDIMLILTSSPKVGICSNMRNLHISSFLRFVPVLWTIDKHCKKFIEAATNNYVGHTEAVYKILYFTGFLQLISDCKVLARNHQKKETWLKFLWKNIVSKSNVVIIRS